ncbi:hypothetical protein KBO27_22455 [Saccharopolyspora endophytica]|uniref:Uncharacterized protein n=1 Tax=Saccharopolyspora endophytica TaxID=543886 RepID=A0ABS5DK98_9PSEU|nr:hypothetical protein [Saccharopolyspora endophytica]MBQ0926720.1 hypothetical protein [Saccharopolyspora endophytica]
MARLGAAGRRAAQRRGLAPAHAAWWQTWRESAQATTFTPTDWDFLLDAALMHHTMWPKGDEQTVKCRKGMRIVG